jgi:hypothetical protein
MMEGMAFPRSVNLGFKLIWSSDSGILFSPKDGKI